MMSRSHGRGATGVACVAAAVLTVLAWIVIAVPPANAAVSSEQAVAYLNQQRADHGIPPLGVSPFLGAGCGAHNYYMEANGLGHGETPGAPRYSEAGAAGGYYAYQAEVLYRGAAYGGSPANPWESAPIHLYLMLSPARTDAGYADSYGFACMRLGGSRVATQPAFFSYPGSGRTIYPSERAGELPYTPQELVGIPAGATTGPNLLLWSLGAGDIRAAYYSLTGPDGPVDVRMVDVGTSNAIGSGHWFRGGGVLIPVNPLKPLSNYTATVDWRGAAGESYIQTVPFSTGPAPTPANEPDGTGPADTGSDQGEAGDGHRGHGGRGHGDRKRKRPHAKLGKAKKRKGRIAFPLRVGKELVGRKASIKVQRNGWKCGLIAAPPSQNNPHGGYVRDCGWHGKTKTSKHKVKLRKRQWLVVGRARGKRLYTIRVKTKRFTDRASGTRYRTRKLSRQYKLLR